MSIQRRSEWQKKCYFPSRFCFGWAARVGFSRGESQARSARFPQFRNRKELERVGRAFPSRSLLSPEKLSSPALIMERRKRSVVCTLSCLVSCDGPYAMDPKSKVKFEFRKMRLFLSSLNETGFILLCSVRRNVSKALCCVAFYFNPRLPLEED